MNHQISPTKVMEDNQATLKQVLNDRITHQVRHLDVLITWLHEHSLRGTFTPEYKNTHTMLADFNTKPCTGKAFQEKVQYMRGHTYLPPPNSEHFRLLQLHQYNLSNPRSQLKAIDLD